MLVLDRLVVRPRTGLRQLHFSDEFLDDVRPDHVLQRRVRAAYRRQDLDRRTDRIPRGLSETHGAMTSKTAAIRT